MSSQGGGSLRSPPPRDGGGRSGKSQNFPTGVGGGTAVQLQRNQNLVFQHRLPGRHVILTRFWGSLEETREHSGTLKLSPATPILPLGHIRWTSTLLLTSISVAPQDSWVKFKWLRGGLSPPTLRWSVSGATLPPTPKHWPFHVPFVLK